MEINQKIINQCNRFEWDQKYYDSLLIYPFSYILYIYKNETKPNIIIK